MVVQNTRVIVYAVVGIIFLGLAGWGVRQEVVGDRYNQERVGYEKRYASEVESVCEPLSRWREATNKAILDSEYIPFDLGIRCWILSNDIELLVAHYEELSSEKYLQYEQPYSRRLGYGRINETLIEWLRQESKTYALAALAYGTREPRGHLVSASKQQDQAAREARVAFWEYASAHMDVKQDSPYWLITVYNTDFPVARKRYTSDILGLTPFQGECHDAVMSYVSLLNFWKPPIPLVSQIERREDRASRFIGYLDLARSYWQGTDEWGVVEKIDSDLRAYFERVRDGEEADLGLATLYFRGEMSTLHIPKEMLDIE